MKEKQSRTIKKKSSINGWKWAFILLVSFIVIGLFLLLRAIQPVTIEEKVVEDTMPSAEKVSLVSSMTTQDAEVILNTAINTMTEDEQISYQVLLENQLEVQSTVQLFNLDISYSLFFDPYVTEDGNLQLRADAIELANFSLPVSAVMSLLAKELDLPPYIGIDSEEQLILIDFNSLSTEYDFSIEMQTVDLESSNIQLKLSVNQDTLIEAMNFQNNSQLRETE